MARFAAYLPFPVGVNLVTLGEGDTPLVRSRRIGPRLGLSDLWFKAEGANPTWSYKDRYVAVTVTVAKALGFRHFVVSSTGNLGVSVAAYAAATGSGCVFIAPTGVPQAVVTLARLYGATVIETEWDARQVLVEHLAGRAGWFPVGLFMPRPIHNPFGIEGYKTIAWEILESLGEPPGAVLFPAARGNGLYGTWKGFVEARRWGWNVKSPQMVACQPIGANSLEVSLQRNAQTPIELPPIRSIAFSTMETVADSCALEAIRESGGTATSARDDEILTALTDLAHEGLFVEPSCALSIACLPHLLERGAIDRARPIVCVLTASGLKWVEHLPPCKPATVLATPTPAALDRVLAEEGLN